MLTRLEDVTPGEVQKRAMHGAIQQIRTKVVLPTSVVVMKTEEAKIGEREKTSPMKLGEGRGIIMMGIDEAEAVTMAITTVVMNIGAENHRVPRRMATRTTEGTRDAENMATDVFLLNIGTEDLQHKL